MDSKHNTAAPAPVIAAARIERVANGFVITAATFGGAPRQHIAATTFDIAAIMHEIFGEKADRVAAAAREGDPEKLAAMRCATVAPTPSGGAARAGMRYLMAHSPRPWSLDLGLGMAVLRDYKGRTVVELGAGEGYSGKALADLAQFILAEANGISRPPALAAVELVDEAPAPTAEPAPSFCAYMQALRGTPADWTETERDPRAVPGWRGLETLGLVTANLHAGFGGLAFWTWRRTPDGNRFLAGIDAAFPRQAPEAAR